MGLMQFIKKFYDNGRARPVWGIETKDRFMSEVEAEKLAERTTQLSGIVLTQDEIEYLSDPKLPRCGQLDGYSSKGCGHLLVFHEYTGGDSPCVICGCC